MSLEDSGANPVVMAKALYGQVSQLGYSSGELPIYNMALSLNIEEIRVEPGLAFEGMVLMPSNKSFGSILIKEARKPRMRFTLAHELFHFLSPLHEPVAGSGFQCDKAAMRLSAQRSPLKTRYERQEAEANQFAAEILMPRVRIRRRLSQEPSLEHVLAMAAEFGVSKEAAAVHYAALHDDPIAIIFSKDGVVRYTVKSKDCPWVTYGKQGMRLPAHLFRGDKRLSGFEDDDAREWTSQSDSEVGEDVQLQTLRQSGGYAMTLLWFSDAEDDEGGPGMDDAFERFKRQQ
ncbi:MAG: ImmA/IrrE family metallo-endopeptidase [Alphaproteobacteria bacterium]